MGISEKVQEWGNKQISKIDDMTLAQKCKLFIKSAPAAKIAGVNLHNELLKGMVQDYDKKQTVAEYLAPYRKEPLFYLCLKKVKLSWQEIEEALNKV